MTIRDIAKLAGVGKSTVSRILSNTGYVNEETRKKVEAVMKEYNYIPSATARYLSKGETDTIGVIIPESSNPFYGEVVSGISALADLNDISMLLCNTNNNPEKEAKALRMLREHWIKGLILTPAFDSSDEKDMQGLIQMLKDMNIPVVTLDRSVLSGTWSSVVFDNFGGAYDAVSALIKGGNSQIGIITGNQKSIVAQERLGGYLKALEDCRIAINPDYIFESDSTEGQAYAITKKLLAEKKLPEAMFVCNNLTSKGFLKAVFEEELVLGKDVCFVGFDHVEALDILNINASYVERDAVNMGWIAMQLLLESFENPDKEIRKQMIPAELVLKGSEKRI
ncbi:LacI family DNA-binding transcriptional regulator [Clostridium sp. MCC353]|uniref:LacI family DNA-binding transcriptional regulator n=1 Tax=Clostridium sp. MCC353 TaxID=2592646 RepID=UPI001C02A0CE|nr:LacI family DNA-binding transcriptional regulator [Clostridium sp. MCC353]MBT9776875.1 LacI family DNA-binding transcriptional regulator [Clostridium sp. MCC353]